MKLRIELLGRVLDLNLDKLEDSSEQPEQYTHDNTASETQIAPQLYYDTEVTAFGFRRR